MSTALTTKEKSLLTEIAEGGMDSPGSGWFHELLCDEPTPSDAGVLGSLVKKGLVTTEEEDDDCCWIQITQSGKDALRDTFYPTEWTLTGLLVIIGATPNRRLVAYAQLNVLVGAGYEIPKDPTPLVDRAIEAAEARLRVLG
jgi:hypothetical protein